MEEGPRRFRRGPSSCRFIGKPSVGNGDDEDAAGIHGGVVKGLHFQHAYFLRSLYHLAGKHQLCRRALVQNIKRTALQAPGLSPAAPPRASVRRRAAAKKSCSASVSASPQAALPDIRCGACPACPCSVVPAQATICPCSRLRKGSIDNISACRSSLSCRSGPYCAGYICSRTPSVIIRSASSSIGVSSSAVKQSVPEV